MNASKSILPCAQIAFPEFEGLYGEDSAARQTLFRDYQVRTVTGGATTRFVTTNLHAAFAYKNGGARTGRPNTTRKSPG